MLAGATNKTGPAPAAAVGNTAAAPTAAQLFGGGGGGGGGGSGGLTGLETANCRVVLRFRPSVPKDKTIRPASSSSSGKYSYAILSPIQVQITKEQIGQKATDNFHFDRIYDGDATQDQVYEHIAKETVEDVLNGYNGTVLCYGQTGAGKTYTMFGPEFEKDGLKGIIPRAISQLFTYITSEREGTEYTIKCSFLEVYKERIRDLLNPKNANLKVRETPSRGVWVDGITEEFVSTESEVMELLKFGAQFRQIGTTSANDSSTRAHSLFLLTLTQKFADGSSKTGKLNLADLAGSENIFRSGATGAQIEEAKKINQSLSALGNCIKALSERQPHVPYRDSKLTHIIRDSLGGNAKTTLVLCCSPHPYDGEQTLSTLRFGQKAKSVRNIVTINRQRSNYELLQIIEMLKKELLAMKKYAEYLEEELRKLKGAGWKPTVPRPNFMSVSIAAMENSAVSASGSPSSQNNGKGSTNRAEGGDDDEADRKEAEDDRNYGVDELSAIDALDVAQLKVELETVREEAQIRIDELTRDFREAVEQCEEDKVKLQKLSEELSARQRELDQLRRETEKKEDALSSQIAELRYEAQKAALDAEEEAAKAKMLDRTNAELLKALDDARLNLARQRELTLRYEENELRRRKEEKEKERIERERAQAAKLEQEASKETKVGADVGSSPATPSISVTSNGSSCPHCGGRGIETIGSSGSVEQGGSTEAIAIGAKWTDRRVGDTPVRALETSQPSTSELHSSGNVDNSVRNRRRSEAIIMGAAERRNSVRQPNADDEGSTAILKVGSLSELIPSLSSSGDLDTLSSVDTTGAISGAAADGNRALLKDSASEMNSNAAIRRSRSSVSLRDSLLQFDSVEDNKQAMHDTAPTAYNKRMSELRKRGVQASEDVGGQSEKEVMREQSIAVMLENSQDIINAVDKLRRELTESKAVNDIDAKRMKNVESRIQDMQQALLKEKEAKNRLQDEFDAAKQEWAAREEELKRQLALYEKGVEREFQRQTVKTTKVVKNQKQRLVDYFATKKVATRRDIGRDPPEKEGWLTKQGGLVKSWKRRYFFLHKGQMLYFDDPSKDKALGVFDLHGCAVMDAEEETKKPFSFAIYHKSQRTYWLQAKDRQEMQEWMATLQQTIDLLDEQDGQQQTDSRGSVRQSGGGK